MWVQPYHGSSFLFSDAIPRKTATMPAFFVQIELLFANRLPLKPDITKWFGTTVSNELLGNDFIVLLMNKKHSWHLQVETSLILSVLV